MCLVNKCKRLPQKKGSFLSSSLFFSSQSALLARWLWACRDFLRHAFTHSVNTVSHSPPQDGCSSLCIERTALQEDCRRGEGGRRCTWAEGVKPIQGVQLGFWVSLLWCPVSSFGLFPLFPFLCFYLILVSVFSFLCISLYFGLFLTSSCLFLILQSCFLPLRVVSVLLLVRASMDFDLVYFQTLRVPCCHQID